MPGCQARADCVDLSAPGRSLASRQSSRPARSLNAIRLPITTKASLSSAAGAKAAVAVGAATAAFAPAALLKLAFVVIGSLIAFKLLAGRDDWRLANDLPGADKSTQSARAWHPGMIGYGFFVGL